jgi:RNA polymerase sigma-70 factor (ECF subfamily)
VNRLREDAEALRLSAAEDLRIMHRLAGGDAEAVGDLYDRHGRAVYALAYRILRDDSEAEDVVQEVFVQAWRQAGAYDVRRGAVAAWLLVMGRTRAIDRLRRRTTRARTVETSDTLPDPVDPGAGPESTTFSLDAATRVRAALDGLSEPQRTSIELAYFEGLSQTEIAERLREPLGTVKTRIRSGLLKLRAALWQE